jgi:hypothetical protein
VIAYDVIAGVSLGVLQKMCLLSFTPKKSPVFSIFPLPPR